MEVDQHAQRPCNWCLDISTLMCSCLTNCGEPTCPYREEFRESMQPVPSFSKMMDALAKQAKVAKSVPKSVPGQPTITDADGSLQRILALHKTCGCKACSEGIRVPICSGCNEWYPCPTVKAVRDPNSSIAPA